MANFYTGSNNGKSGLRMTDDADDVFGVTWITVSNGTLTDNGNGHVTLQTGGGGGGGGISFNGSTTNGLVTYGNATTADVEANLTFNGSLLLVTGGITATTTIEGGTITDGTASLTGGAISGLTTPLSVGQGGTGNSSLTDGGIYWAQEPQPSPLQPNQQTDSY